MKLTLTDGDSVAGVALRAESANLWHRRVGHINGRYLDVLRRVPGNGVEFTGELQSCDSSALQPAHVIPSGYRLGRVKGDRGGEFTSNAFRQYCRQVGVRLEFAATNTPQEIGANERVGRTLAGMVRCLLADSGLPHFLWGELFLTASYLCN